MNWTKENKVSWSKNGIIAYGDNESADGNLAITFLESINGVNWRFHPPQRYIIHPQLHEQNKNTTADNSTTNITSTLASSANNAIVSSSTSSMASKNNLHTAQFFYDISSVYWNNWFNLPGDMLAVCDELGNMTMLISGQSSEGTNTFEKLTMLFQDNIYKIHNHIMVMKPITERPKLLERKQTKKEYHTAILDFHWIASSKGTIISQFCALETATNLYRNKVQQIPPFGVFHPPFMKYACCAIRKNAQIDFWYQFSNSKDHKKITLQLNMDQNQIPIQNKESDWLHFAKITPINDGQCLLITAYSLLTNSLSFYKLYVSWNTNPANKSATLNDPTLRIENIFNLSLDEVDSLGNVLKLSNLHVTTKIFSEKETYPDIILNYDIKGSSKSLVKRLKLSNTYLSADYLMILKQNTTNNDNNRMPTKTARYNVRFYNDLYLDNKVVNISTEMLDCFITFYFDDGSIASYNLSDWQLETDRLVNQAKQGKFTNVITSVLSTGLKYPKSSYSTAIDWIAVSPTMSGIIYKIKGQVLPKFDVVYRHDISNPEKDIIDATSFAFTFVGATQRQLSTEDLSIACKTHVFRIGNISVDRAIKFIRTLMRNLYPFFNVSLDAPKDIMEKMIVSRHIQKIMLLQIELGSAFNNNEKITEMGRIILYLKNVLFSFNGVARNLQFAIEQMTGTQNNPNLKNPNKSFQTAFSKQDLIHSLIPMAVWFVKFITYLLQEIIMLANNPTSTKKCLVLGVFGSKMSRQLLLSILLEIKKISTVMIKFPETTYPVLNQSSSFLKRIFAQSLISFEILETFLTNVSNKFAALSEDHSKNTRENILNLEHSLLINAEIPEENNKVAEFLISYSSSTLISHIRLADVYFSDTSGIRISNDEYFAHKLKNLLQPIEKGLVVSDMSVLEDFQNSKSFSQLMYDGVTFDKLSKLELKNSQLKRCSRCGCITRAGYTVSPDKTIVPTSIKTKRWPAMYTRLCICSGLLYELH